MAGYAAAAAEFDRFLADFIPGMREGDLLMITADHGCDPSYTKTTDHTREYVPYLVCGKGVKPGVDLGTKLCFGTIAQTSASIWAWMPPAWRPQRVERDQGIRS